ncbi:MAG: ABC transporter ATP-binding protein [Candidatus Caldarchaeum sp.]|nr:ABC transporter ATP-binding protein [Candidatus Caldarchaeum sp.]
MVQNNSILETKNLVLKFGGLTAVDNVSLTIEKSKITALIGPNGSGKTSLFNVLSGIYVPTSGKVYFEGKDITALPPHKIYELGIVRSFQFPQLFYKMTVYDNIVFAGRKQVGDNPLNAVLARNLQVKQEKLLREKALEILDLLDLGDHVTKFPGQLSGGQLKLLELGRSLMADPKLLLLDEPAAGVSPVLVKKIFDIISKFRVEKGMTVLVIEHRLQVVEEFADWIYVMHRGRIFLSGKPSQVLTNEQLLTVYSGGRVEND